MSVRPVARHLAALLCAVLVLAGVVLGADFTLRANARFHNGEPVTSEDVTFSFERYRGGAAKVLTYEDLKLRRP